MSDLSIFTGKGNALAEFVPTVKNSEVVKYGVDSLPDLYDADYCTEMGHEARKIYDMKNACEWYERALNIEKDHQPALFWLGYSLLPGPARQGISKPFITGEEAVKRARTLLKRLLRLTKEDPRGRFHGSAMHNLGVAEDFFGNHSKEEQWYRKRLEIDPYNAHTLCNLGINCRQMNRTDEAVECFNKAISADKFYPMPYYWLGLHYNRTGEYEKAVKYLEDYLKYPDFDDWDREETEAAVRNMLPGIRSRIKKVRHLPPKG